MQLCHWGQREKTFSVLELRLLLFFVKRKKYIVKVRAVNPDEEWRKKTADVVLMIVICNWNAIFEHEVNTRLAMSSSNSTAKAGVVGGKRALTFSMLTAMLCSYLCFHSI